jgi:uncharacterized membrane protein
VTASYLTLDHDSWRMLDSLRAYGPVALVPLAWTFITGAHLGYVGDHSVFVAHVVMVVVLAGFAVLSWRDMTDGALRTWRAIIVAGIPVTLLGLASFFVRTAVAPLRTAAVVGWMLLPAYGLYETATAVDSSQAPGVYVAGAGLSGAGTVVYLAAVAAPEEAVPVAVIGLTLVNVGQSASIVNAARH